MNSYSWVSAAFVYIIIIYVVGCATPSSPTGGPPDEEGPKIVRTEPETGTTNFSGSEITLHFSEFVDRGSLNEAIVIEPDIGISYELDWGRKSVDIEFDQALPDTTTLIVTVGTEFTDTNNNEMSQPQKVAVSTGPDIDDGSLVGKVLDAKTGKGTSGERILLYREPYDLTQKASYIASTDTAGTFTFSYLRQGTYKAFWVDDRNRNKIWDREQERAQPFNEQFFELSKGAEDTLGTVFKTSVDTTRPKLQGIGLFSSQRLRMRFSENIELTDSTSISIVDSTEAFYSSAFPLYIQPDEQFVLFAHSEEELAEEATYGMNIRGIVDGSGNQLAEITQTFTGSAQEDTTQQRIIQRNNLSGYYPGDSVKVTYAKPINEESITDSLKIVQGDSLINDWPDVQTQNNKLIIPPDNQWKDGVNYEIRVWDPRIEDYRNFEPEIWHTSEMGGLEAIVEDSTMNNIHLQIFNEESGIQRDTVFSDTVELENLPPLNYTVIAYQDRNKNGQWDFGEVDPYEAPEPYFIQQDVPIERDMIGELTIIFSQ